MHQTDIMLYLAFFAQIVWYFTSQNRLKKEIESLKTELKLSKSDYTRLNVELADFVKRLSICERDCTRFDEKGFANLANRITEAVTKTQELDHEVRRVDTSVKTFYSTWARKLGILAKERENQDVEPQAQYYEPEPEKPKKFRIARV